LRFRRRADALLAAVDAGVAVAASAIAFSLRYNGEHVPSSYLTRYEWATGFLAVIWIISGRLLGLYRRSTLRPGSSLLEPAFSAALTSGLVLYLLDLVAFGSTLSRGWVGLVVLGLMLFGMAARGGLRRVRRMLVPLGVGLERYAILGDDDTARRLHADLTRAPGAPFIVTELIPGDCDADEIARRAQASHVDGLIVPAGHEPSDVGRLAALLSGADIEVLLAPKFGELDMRVASIATFQGVPLLRVAGASPRRRAIRQRAHRDLRHGVAIIGTRGIPANYGGFETFAERFASHLVDRGVPVTVYCRRHYATAGREWQGVRLVTLPTIKSKHLDTVIHTALSVLHLVLTSRIRDVVLCNAANAPVLPLLRLTGRRTVMNVDGLEWRRSKWGVAGRAWYHAGEWLSVRLASALVTDAEEVRTYYRVRHDSDSVMIPYGADLLPRTLPLPAELGVSPDSFVLYVSRWERENNPELVAAAHAAAGVELPLVMLGQATYDAALDQRVRAAAAPHAVLPGPVFGEGYRGLQANARAYIHATEVGGTHPALIEAMAAGNLCIVLDTPENREVAGAVAWMFADAEQLAACLRQVEALTPVELDTIRAATRTHAAARYSWQVVGDSYLELLGRRSAVSPATDGGAGPVRPLAASSAPSTTDRSLAAR
jgi:glycosyltransferase involved in cell wall biosynthesis